MRKLSYLAILLISAPLAVHAANDAPKAEANIRQPTAADPKKSDPVNAPVSKITHKKPIEVADAAKPGTIHNPYTGQKDMIEAGQKVFSGAGCPGCHGGGGGGGICPSIKNDIWVYGSDDDTLFRLISYGSDQLQKKGYVRKGNENVVAPMPPFGTILKDNEEVFKAMAYIRSLYSGSKDHVNW